MKSLLACAAVIGSTIVACTDEPVVLATLPAVDGGGPSPTGVRCVDVDDCPVGSFCERPACDAPAGSCRPFPVVCPNDETPVCGCDGITYFNECLLRAAGASIAHPGECELDAVTCHDRDDCPTRGSCAKLVGSDPRGCGPEVPGRCWVLPATCPPPARPDRWAPCAPPPPGAPPPPCVDTCNAIRIGMPHHRELRCE